MIFKSLFKDKGFSLLSLWFFLLPIYSFIWSNLPSVVLLICSIVFILFERRKRSESSILLILVLLFYLISIIGVFYSLYPHKGMYMIHQQLSMLLLAVIVYVRRLTLRELQHLAFLVVGGTLAVGIFLFIKSINISLENSDYMQMFYDSFAPTTRFYPTYLSLFLSFSMVVLFVSFKKKCSLFIGTNLFHLITLLFLGVFTFCLDSKVGTLSMFVIVIYFSVWFIIKDFKLEKVLLVPAICFMLFNIFVASPRNLMMVDSLGERNQGTSTVINATSTSQRVIFIKAAIKTIPKTFPWGEGSYGKKATPEFSKTLEEFLPSLDTYSERPRAIRRSNAHNQFLDTTMQHGLVGLVVLCALLACPFVFSILKNDYVVPLLIIVVTLFFCVEGIVLKSYGTRYFSALWLFFLIPSIRKNSPYHLKETMNINIKLTQMSSFFRDESGFWDIKWLLLGLFTACVLMLFIVTNDIAISYNNWNEYTIRETKTTYIPWFVITIVIYLLRSFIALVRKEKNKKWVLYVILLLFQPLMIFFYM